jgi:uncharacterized coiled-coil protein SlyX
MKDKALEIANWLEAGEVERYDIDEASAMIRRLVKELDENQRTIDGDKRLIDLLYTKLQNVKPSDVYKNQEKIDTSE